MPYVERCVECSGTGKTRPSGDESRYLPYHAWALDAEDAPTGVRCSACGGEGLVGGPRRQPRRRTQASDGWHLTSLERLQWARALLPPTEVEALLGKLTPGERERLLGEEEAERAKRRKDSQEAWRTIAEALRPAFERFATALQRLGTASRSAGGADVAYPPPVPLERRGSRKDRRQAHPSDPREVLFDRSSHRYRGRA